jgi:hypothetical protein
MASPAYSIVIVETTASGVTTHVATAYKFVKDANAAFSAAVTAGNRAFLYVQPHPNKFHRNDTQPNAVS